MRPFVDVTSSVEDPMLRRAVELAERARGATAPNPLVGCVVVSGDRIVGEGYHPRAGEPHAEVFALAAAGEHARGADVYVTLEPCTHHGRTPPCTDALMAAGVASVTIGMADPSAEAGGGADTLRSAGIAVRFSPDPAPFAELNRGWLKRLAAGRPWLTAKVGTSLDARVALQEGQRASMTGPAGSVVTRTLRSRADAVLVGAATAIADDPALTVRDEAGRLAEHQPLRVVLAGERPLPDDLRLFTDDLAPTVVLAASGSPATARFGAGATPISGGVGVVTYESDAGLRGAFAALGRHGVNELLIEPGTRLLTALWAEGLIDELVTVTAGGMAGSSAPSLFSAVGDVVGGDALDRLLTPVQAGIVGDVSVTVWRPNPGTGDV